jgi:NAD(P)-dependent dehydrogenase (short-subunit alcohol dehydrogenase family)
MIKNKVVVITGGLGLIGQEYVRAVVENHGIAIIADNNKQIGSKIRERLISELKSDSLDFIKLDINAKDSITSMIDIAHKRYGKVDALVNNAFPRNKNYGRPFFEVEYLDFCENINQHLGGYFLMSQQMAKYFLKQGYGNIVNISSIYGVIPPRFEVYKNTSMTVAVEYAAIKSAIIHLTKYMAKYFKGMNIRVNTLSPGGVLDNQPQQFLDEYRKHCLTKGMLHKTDLNGTLIYLLSDFSLHLNGQNIVVDDGYSL